MCGPSSKNHAYAQSSPTANPNANQVAQALLTYLTNQANNCQIISGQQVGHGTGISDSYSNLVSALQNKSGQWVGFTEADYYDWDGSRDYASFNQPLIDHWKNGGLVGVSWHAPNPWTGGDAWDQHSANLTELVDSNRAIHETWLTMLDEVAAGLAHLQEAGVVVLWRPFHEMNGNWFWWGANVHPNDPAPYQRLWQHMFDYFTKTKGLDNLLWVYGTAIDGGESWHHSVAYDYPGDRYVDIVGQDVYDDQADSMNYDDLLALNKPVALTEFGPLTVRDGTFDYTQLITQLKNRYPKVVYWLSWHDWRENDNPVYISLLNNRNGDTILHDPCVTNRDEIDFQEQPPAADYHTWLLQQLENEYGLTGGQWLFADNEVENINSVGVYGEASASQLVSVAEMPFTQALQIHIESAPDLMWESGALLQNRQPLSQGDTILLVAWVRGSDAAVGDGYIRGKMENGVTFAAQGEAPILLTPEWQQIFIPATAQQAFAAGGANYVYHTGAMAQTVEIGGLAGINYGQSVTINALPATPIDQYAGQEADAAWRTAAAQRIEQHRKRDITVIVRDRAGRPIPNATVHIEMKRHKFAFGSALSLEDILGTSQDAATYRQKITNLDGNGHGFNWGVMEWSLQWRPWEGYPGWNFTSEQAVQGFSWARSQGLEMRAHSGIWGGFQWMPSDIEENQNNPAYVRQRLTDRIQTVLTHPVLSNQVREWDLINETRSVTDLAEIFRGEPGYPTGEEIYTDIFKLAEATNPNLKYFLNDYSILSEGGLATGAHRRFHQIITDLKNRGGRLDGIGMQAHMNYPLAAPERLYAVLDNFATYGQEIRITEYDLEITDEAQAADYTRDFMTLIFSHPSVTGFMMWNFWDPIHWKRNAPLFRADWSLKPAGQQYMDLVFKQWWTDESAQTDNGGTLQRRGFLGDYNITATFNGLSSSQTLTVEPDGSAVEITLDTVVQPPTPVAKSMRTTSPPQIDGEIDPQWAIAPRYPMENVVIGSAVPAVDVSGEFRMLHDDTHLYFLVEITDDVRQNDSGAEWWEDDAVEIYLNGDHSQSTDYDGINDYQLVFRWHDSTLHNGPNSAPFPVGLQQSMVDSDDGYRLEVGIPLAQIGMANWNGSEFGLDVHVIDDDDGGQRETKLAWHTEVDDTWFNPSLFGTGRASSGILVEHNLFLPILRR